MTITDAQVEAPARALWRERVRDEVGALLQEWIDDYGPAGQWDYGKLAREISEHITTPDERFDKRLAPAGALYCKSCGSVLGCDCTRGGQPELQQPASVPAGAQPSEEDVAHAIAEKVNAPGDEIDEAARAVLALLRGGSK